MKKLISNLDSSLHVHIYLDGSKDFVNPSLRSQFLGYRKGAVILSLNRSLSIFRNAMLYLSKVLSKNMGAMNRRVIILFEKDQKPKYRMRRHFSIKKKEQRRYGLNKALLDGDRKKKIHRAIEKKKRITASIVEKSVWPMEWMKEKRNSQKISNSFVLDMLKQSEGLPSFGFKSIDYVLYERFFFGKSNEFPKVLEKCSKLYGFKLPSIFSYKDEYMLDFVTKKKYLDSEWTSWLGVNYKYKDDFYYTRNTEFLSIGFGPSNEGLNNYVYRVNLPKTQLEWLNRGLDFVYDMFASKILDQKREDEEEFKGFRLSHVNNESFFNHVKVLATRYKRKVRFISRWEPGFLSNKLFGLKAPGVVIVLRSYKPSVLKSEVFSSQRRRPPSVGIVNVWDNFFYHYNIIGNMFSKRSVFYYFMSFMRVLSYSFWKRIYMRQKSYRLVDLKFMKFGSKRIKNSEVFDVFKSGYKIPVEYNASYELHDLSRFFIERLVSSNMFPYGLVQFRSKSLESFGSYPVKGYKFCLDRVWSANNLKSFVVFFEHQNLLYNKKSKKSVELFSRYKWLSDCVFFESVV